MTPLQVAAVALITALVIIIGLNFVPPEKKVERNVEHSRGHEDEQIVRELSVLLGPPILDGCNVRALQDGDEIFPAMLDAIRAARRTVTFESYIYWSGDIGRAFAAALSERARANVKVHVLLDWAGSYKVESKLLAEMTEAGVEIKRFHPLNWYHLSRMNNRTHRKVLVVDGSVGFTGGVGIAEPWTGHSQDPDHWRDSHFEFTGPVVAQAQSVFVDNWIKVTGAVLRGKEYFPSLPPVGTMPAQMFSSSPTGGSESMQLMYLLTIANATTSIDLAAAYFVPDRLMLRALTAALARGVTLRIIVPGKHTDSHVVRYASRHSWGELLQAGAQIHEFQPTMYHCKVLIVDQWLVSVGSTNFDSRSFRLNAEASLNVLDRSFAKSLTTVFEKDLARSRQISLAEWAKRPLRERFVEVVTAPLSSQL
ncbi:MAG: phospholipase D-like domain-containing protein [Gemmatimonadaceae bacterium]